jgi:hypothetical protein
VLTDVTRSMTTAQQVIYERPPDGMARGRFPVPWWVIVALAAAIVVAAAVFLIVRLVVGARVAKDRVGPPSP